MDELVVKWPARTFAFYAQVRANSDAILNKTILAIDPSSGGSSQPGYAIFKAGELVDSGELCIPAKKAIHERLHIMQDMMQNLLPAAADVLAIEDVSYEKFSHVYLKWAVGATIAATKTKVYLLVPLNCWKAISKAMPAYQKTNATDAILIGQTLVLLARKFQEEKNAKVQKSRRKTNR